jgi:predicted GIY-YIG superfamily endonuclease
MKPWTLYLLYNPEHNNRSYVGCTTDIERRILQHNKLLPKGAKSTEPYAPTWKVYATITGFTDKSTVMRFEKIIKMRGIGLTHRNRLFIMVGRDRKCPPGNQYLVPEGLEYVKY